MIEPLKLTQKQKDKLLEMFDKINPKYKSVEVTHAGLICYSKSGNFPCNVIHWVEFCILHVFPKVGNLYDSKLLSDFYYAIFGYKFKSSGNKSWEYDRFIHPVDYLYEEFLKLKDDKKIA